MPEYAGFPDFADTHMAQLPRQQRQQTGVFFVAMPLVMNRRQRRILLMPIFRRGRNALPNVGFW